MLVHGFASNKDVNWVYPTWVSDLKKHGYRVLVISDPQRALDRFKEDQPPAQCVIFCAGAIGEAALDAVGLSGFEARPIPMHGLSQALDSCAVFLDDFVVPVENRLGEEGEGFQIAMHAMQAGRLNVAARSVGIAQACLDEALRCKETGEEKVILTALCGHGHLDLAAYEQYLAGEMVDLDLSDEAVARAMSEIPVVAG